MTPLGFTVTARLAWDVFVLALVVVVALAWAGLWISYRIERGRHPHQGGD